VLLGRRSQGGDIVYLVDACIGPRVVASPDALRLDNATYISPEVASGEAASFRSDLYALGCLLFELLAGKPLFERPNLPALLTAHREQTPPALPRDLEVPEPVRALIASLLAKDPRRRPFSAQQVRRTLDPFLPAEVPPAPSARSSAPPPPSAAGRLSAPNPDATQELGPDDLRFAVSLPLDRRIAPSRTPTLRPSEMRPVRFPAPSPAAVKTQELNTAELEQITHEPKTRVRSSAPARPSTLGMSKRMSQRAVDDSAPTTALSLEDPHVAPARVHSAPPPPAAEAEQSSEIDLTPLIEAEEASAEASALQPPDSSPSIPPPSAASVPPPVPEHVAAASISPPSAASAPPAVPSVPPPSVASVPAASPASAASVPPPKPDRSAPPEPMVLKSLPAASAGISGAGGSTASGGRKVSAPDETPNASAATGSELSSVDAVAVAPATAEVPRRSWKPVADVQPVGGPKNMSEASQTLSLRPERDLSSVLRASRRASLTESPVILLWSAAALIAGAVMVRAVRGSGPVHVGAVEVPTSESVHVTVPSADTPAAPAAPSAPAAAPQPSAAPAAAPPAAAPAANEPAAANEAAAQPNDDNNPEGPAPAEDTSHHRETLSAAQAGKSFRGRSELDYKLKAREFFRTGKYREAAENYAHATRRAPTDSAAFAGLGASWLAAGEPNRAIVAYQRAVQLKPDVSGFQAALGRAYATKGDRPRATAAYTKALKLDPNNQAAKAGLASVKR
jgi:serine/threonine protein kinase